MNTQLKVGDRVRVISGANILEHNNQFGIIQQIGEPTMPLFTDYMAVKLDSGIVALCYTYEGDDRVANIELLEAAKPTPKWLPIDKDNLPVGQVAFINNDEAEPIVYAGWLTLSNDVINVQHSAYGSMFTYHKPTHYIPLTDLLQLPIAE